jgi:hypothetical protein
MVWLRVFALLRHFYFNYNYVDSNVPLIHSLFARRAQFSLRIVISFLVSAFLAYGSSLRNQLIEPFLIPLISVLAIQDSVGFTMAGGFQMIFTLVPVSVFLFIVQKIGLGYHDYIAAEFILLITTFFIAFVIKLVRTSRYIQFASGYLVISALNKDSNIKFKRPLTHTIEITCLYVYNLNIEHISTPFEYDVS